MDKAIKELKFSICLPVSLAENMLRRGWLTPRAYLRSSDEQSDGSSLEPPTVEVEAYALRGHQRSNSNCGGNLRACRADDGPSSSGVGCLQRGVLARLEQIT